MNIHRHAPKLLALAATAALLSACGGSSGGGNTVVAPVTTPAPFAYMFGNGFGADFTTVSTTPALLTGSELNPVSLTASPTPFPAGTVGTN